MLKSKFLLFVILTYMLEQASYAQDNIPSVEDYLNKISEDVPSTINSEFEYKINRINLPNPSAAQSLLQKRDAFLEQAKAHGGTADSMIRAYDTMIEDIRKGSKITINCNIWISSEKKLILEYTYPDSFVQRYYVNPNNVAIEDPRMKTLKIMGAIGGSYNDQTFLFPGFAQIFDRTAPFRFIIENKELVLEKAEKDLAIFHRFYFGQGGLITHASQVSYADQTLATAEFAYEKTSKPLPSSIIYKKYAPDGSPVSVDNWTFIAKIPITGNVVFDPIVDKTYNILDETGSHIPPDEMDKLLHQ